MAKYFPVSPAIWNKRIVSLGRDCNLLYAYVLTSPHRASEGLFRLPKAYVAADMNFTVQEVEAGLTKLMDAGLVQYDDEAEVVLLPDALRYQAPRAKNQVSGAIKKLEQLRATQTRLLPEFIRIARTIVKPDPEKDLDGVHPLIARIEEHFPEESALAEQLGNTWPTPDPKTDEHSPVSTLEDRHLGEGLGVVSRAYPDAGMVTRG